MWLISSQNNPRLFNKPFLFFRESGRSLMMACSSGQDQGLNVISSASLIWEQKLAAPWASSTRGEYLVTLLTVTGAEGLGCCQWRASWEGRIAVRKTRQGIWGPMKGSRGLPGQKHFLKTLLKDFNNLNYLAFGFFIPSKKKQTIVLFLSLFVLELPLGRLI